MRRLKQSCRLGTSGTTLLGLLLVHAALICLLIWGDRPARLAIPPVIMVATAIPDANTAPPIVQEPIVTTVQARIEPPEFVTAADIASALPTPAASAGCTLSDTVQAALAASPAVKRALGHMPGGARSVSGATLLWDGDWTPSDIVSEAVLQAAAAIVIATVRAAPPDCRDTPVTGPRLLFVSGADTMHVLAFGSGAWKWSQLLQNVPDRLTSTLGNPPQSK